MTCARCGDQRFVCKFMTTGREHGCSAGDSCMNIRRPCPDCTAKPAVEATAIEQCVCGHAKSQHREVASTNLPPTVLACMVPGCACAPGCIHEGYVSAEATAAPERAYEPVSDTHYIRADLIERLTSELAHSKSREADLSQILDADKHETLVHAAAFAVSQLEAKDREIAKLRAALNQAWAM